jgi:drug/metabolite transporter (DMT)-like permease
VAASPWNARTRGAFALLVVFWGFNYIFVNVGLGSASPSWLAALRALTGTAASVPIVLAFGRWGTLDLAGKRDALLLGLPTTGLFFGLWFWAQTFVLPGVAAVVVYTFPLWVAILSYPILGHRLGPRHWISVAVGFVGVALIAQILASGSHALYVPALVALVGAAASWGLATVLFQRRFPAEQMVEANLYQLVGGSAFLIAWTLVVAPYPLPHWDTGLVVSLLWMGILGTSVAYAIWSILLGRVRAATASAFLFLVPVVTLAASAVLFGERLSYLQLVGVGLVLASIYGIGRAAGASDPPRPGSSRVSLGHSGVQPRLDDR